MKFLSAAHRLEVSDGCADFSSGGALVLAAPGVICAKFCLNLSRSRASNFSFFFKAPGLLFKLRCLILALPSVASAWPEFSASGSASARDSRVVISFLEGLLRFNGLAFSFSILEINEECLMRRLSSFVDLNASPDVDFDRKRSPILFRVGFLFLIVGA
jgi:hypothetical protein